MTTVSSELIEAATEAASRSVSKHAEDDKPSMGLGAAVRAEDGEIYTGSVVETRDYHQSIHAERLAVFKAITAREERNYVEEVAVFMPMAIDEKSKTLSVCGSCLHLFSEFSEGNPLIRLEGLKGGKDRTLKDLYPDPWLDSWETAEPK